MGYSSLAEAVTDLERAGHLLRLREEVDPVLEAAELQRRVYQVGGPAIYFSKVRGSTFPMVSNLFGTIARARFLFRDSLAGVRALVSAKVDPSFLLRSPTTSARLPLAALHLLPERVSRGPVLLQQTSISALPRLVSWPDDGGAFLTLPQVFSEDPRKPGLTHSNLGMYRVQLDGNDYEPDREVGLHYQIHRGIGVHHAAAIERNEPLRVNIFLGGPPAMTVAAVMPLPEGLPEIAFAGALNHRRIRMIPQRQGPAIHADADICIRGYILPSETKPEGPFGDHLGYYARQHAFPVLHVESVFARPDAIFPFTTVGRPPQEDTVFGELIHELTGPLVPTVLPGVQEVHAVDAAGVHPLLLAIGSERYVPYAKARRPMELLTQAHAILGQGQMSLAKYLFIAAREDEPALSTKNVAVFFQHVLERIDPSRDLHFQTNTTMDTLDYSGSGLNAGSKVVIAVAGEKRRELARALPTNLRLSEPFQAPRLAMPGVLVVQGPAHAPGNADASALAQALAVTNEPSLPLVVLCDDSEFCARNLANFLWVTFTRSNPAVDMRGVHEFVENKAWGCRGAIVIDARCKSHHAPALVEDPAVTRRVDALVQRTPELKKLGL